MRIAQPIRFSVWSMIILNLLMAFISIWLLMRITPTIESILSRNDQSLRACEEMFAILSQVTDSTSNKDSLELIFANHFSAAHKNITEVGEKESLDQIRKNYSKALKGDSQSLNATIEAIKKVSELNRNAMRHAKEKAMSYSTAGAWLIVFMAIFIFLGGLSLTRSLGKNMIEPMEEILAVVAAQKQGDRQRRCALGDYPTDIRMLFVDFNGFIDRSLRASNPGITLYSPPEINLDSDSQGPTTEKKKKSSNDTQKL